MAGSGAREVQMNIEENRQARIDNYVRYRAFADIKGVTDYQVSRETGMNRAVLSEWKNGKSQPKADKLLKIADYLGIRMESLLG